MGHVLPIDAILARRDLPPAGERIGRSIQGREITGHRIGDGPVHISLIAGCHADEPVGPAMLEKLVAHLSDPLLGAALRDTYTFFIVPHANPDGKARNLPWTSSLIDLVDGGRGVDLAAYLRHVVREPPGDDVEFGFPRDDGDVDARPENLAVASFLRDGAPYALHASFHGMAFAAGPWFLLDEAWVDRTSAMRDDLRHKVEFLGYTVHDIDRGGDKGFTRIDQGFTTRPDSRAMVAYFRDRGDEEMAAKFRPSSMEYIRRLGGDPLTLVTEMPLFLLPAEAYHDDPLHPEVVARLRAAALGDDTDAFEAEVERTGVRPMPIADQMRFQLAYLDAAINAIIGT